MTVATYALGRPFAAVSRGGDCRARDLTQGRDIHGPHVFTTTTACQITNGILRATVGATGAAPSLTIEGWRGAIALGGGGTSTPAWFAMGFITIDALPAALLTGVQLDRITPEAVTLRLVAPAMGDAYVTLRRGERMLRIQHGNPRAGAVNATRRVIWSGPTGTATSGRVTESTAAVEGFPRFLAAIDTVAADGAVFSLTAVSVTTARFGVGIATTGTNDTAADYHAQLADASRSRLVVMSVATSRPIATGYGGYEGGY